MSMPGIMGFHGRRNRSFDDPYSSGSEGHGRDARHQRRQFDQFMQRQAYMRARGGQQSPFGGMANFHSPFMGRGGHSPLRGGFSPPGFSSPLGTGMGMGIGGGMGPGLPMGIGMGVGMGMGIGIRPGMGMAMGLHGGMGRGMGHMNRSPFLGGSPMGHRQASPFGSGSLHRPHSSFPGRYRHHDQPLWPQTRRSPFASSLFDDDEDDESDYETSSMYGFPRRRREGFSHLGRSPFQNRGTPPWMYGHNDSYDDFDDMDDDDDDESDFEDYYPMRRRQQRY
jgi:hypothetical protein